MCNQLDLQTIGSQPVIMPKNLPDHRLCGPGRVSNGRELGQPHDHYLTFFSSEEECAHH